MTWSAPADLLSTRNCTCMSIQPSSRLSPSTLGTSRRFVRYILGVGTPSRIFAIALFAAFAKAAPIFSACELMLVLRVGDRPGAQPRNHCRRGRAHGRHS